MLDDAPPQALISHSRLLLLTQYASRLPPRSSRFLWPPPRLLLHVQYFLPADLLGLDEDGQVAGTTTHQAEIGYQKTFIKELIKRIEDAIHWAVDNGAEGEDWVGLLPGNVGRGWICSPSLHSLLTGSRRPLAVSLRQPHGNAVDLFGSYRRRQ
jgi:hypothetical protein